MANANSQLQKVVIPSMQQPSGNKVAVISLVRRLTGLGLAQARELVESSNPVIKDGITPDEASKIVDEFNELGVKVTALNSSAKSECPVCCPKCGSTAIKTGSSGFSILSRKTSNSCRNCGYKWTSNE